MRRPIWEEAIWRRTKIGAGPATNRFQESRSTSREAAGRRRNRSCPAAKRAFGPNGKSNSIAGKRSIRDLRRKRRSIFTHRARRLKPQLRKQLLKRLLLRSPPRNLRGDPRRKTQPVENERRRVPRKQLRTQAYPVSSNASDPYAEVLVIFLLDVGVHGG